VACFIAVVNPTQPDVASGAAIQPLALGPNNHVAASQTAGNMDAYSSYWTFAANRAHLSGKTCSTNADCQAGQACNASGVCH
jgi:hypothetical protein